MMDPLTGAVCDPNAIWQMVDEMLIAEAEWLPQYAEEIEAAKVRMDERKANGTFISKHRDDAGAAKIHEKTVEEMQAEADERRKLAAKTDKTH